MIRQAPAGDPQETVIPIGRTTLHGTLGIPREPLGTVLFGHGGGSSRSSPPNRYVADAVRQAGFATLHFDLLTAEEEAIDARTGQLRFDVPLLAERLVGAMDWIAGHPELRGLPVGLFGASTGAAAALIAAAQRPNRVAAVVSRGGRPDLARVVLARVRAPTLLIVGARDTAAMGMNEQAREQMTSSPVELAIVRGATHLFEEPGALHEVARLAREWFTRFLPPAETGPAPA